MSRPTRIGAIYRKELVSILRDRRTMLAMVVIPVVLYPLLMLGFVRAMESEQLGLRAQPFTVEVDDETTAGRLRSIIDAAQLTDEGSDEQPATFDIRVGRTPPEELGDDAQLHVSLQWARRREPFPPQLAVELIYNEINVRSRTAMEQLTAVFDRARELATRDSLQQFLRQLGGQASVAAGVDLILKPIEVSTISSATRRQRGGWALGQIVPIILVLMTITGAVYPAIDLTAGERERGTLETLLATPVPILHLIVAKFLVVATIALLAAVINVTSVGATMHFGGITRSIAAELPVEFPAAALPIILLCMVPFALLSSALLIAACSFARTFKEAQNYVMPIIILALIPAVAVTLPSVRLTGILLVVPVGNMVLLTRELFQQTGTWSQVVVVLLSTGLYAAAAVAAAARLFGQEAVLFADAGSYKTLLKRRLLRSRPTPTPAQALLLAAVLFPAAFYANSLLVDTLAKGFIRTMTWLAVVQFAGLFVLLPVALAIYLKIDLATTFRLRLPPARAWLAAILIGASSWVLTHEFFVLQARWVITPSAALKTFSEQVGPQLAASPIWLVVLLMAIIPAASEEFLFRGFLLSGVAGPLRKWSAIVTIAAIFGIFHFLIDKMPVTFLLGIVLGYLCWQYRSIWPGILVHVMHNGSLMVLTCFPKVVVWLGLPDGNAAITWHLPARVVVLATILFVTGLAIVARKKNSV